MPGDPATVKFNSLLDAFGLLQHVRAPTHLGGHNLDVIITRSELTVGHVDVSIAWPDHSRIVAGLDLLFPQDHTTVLRTTRSWRTFNFHAFIRDLRESSLLCQPPTDVDQLFDCYHQTLQTLVDLHAPLKTSDGSMPTAQLAGTMLNVGVQKDRLGKWRGGIGSTARLRLA